MGKKRIKIQEDEAKKPEGAADKKEEMKGRSTARVIQKAVIHINASYNNTLISVADEKGNTLGQSSAGAMGFKGTKKSTPYAAARVAEGLFEKISRFNVPEAVILVKGVGSGRESAIRSFANKGLNISLIKDITPIPHNGPRARKARRV